MGSSRVPHFGRASLRVEGLEDRLTPSFDPTALAGLSGQVAAGAVASDRVTVILSDGASSALLASPDVSRVRPLGNGIYSVILRPGADLGTALTYYGTLGGVATAELDGIVSTERKPNDTRYAAQYGPAKIGAEAAWDRFTGNPGFIVGVLDSGLDYTHPDLAANVWTNPGEIAGNGIDDDNNGYVDDIRGWNFAADNNNPFDDDGHGTHVSGTIGAVGNNRTGVAGVSWSVRLMAVPFLGIGPNAGMTSSAIAALNYTIDMGAKVTNNSWGSNASGGSVAFARTLGRAQSVGQIFVASAGNIGVNNDFNALRFPSNYSAVFDNVIAVAAVDRNDKIADFSNFGAGTVTLAAPGVGVVSTVPIGSDRDGVVDGYESYDGTSMAAPHVTGAIALYWGANPTLTYNQVINKLKSSVDKIPSLAGVVSTGGRLNVGKMFNVTPVPPVVVNAPAGTEIVRVLGPGGVTTRALDPHPGYLGGVVAASGDVTGDGVADVVTAASFGGHVKVFNGVNGAELRSFYAFPGYKGPISLAVGDLTGDGIGDIIVAANQNGHVKVFDGVTGRLTFSSLVYQGYAGTIAVSAADTDGDGRNELITAADAGFGVHVKAFAAGTPTLRDSFLATAPGAWSSFSVSAVDLDLDGVAELLVSQGPRVRVIDARTKAVRADFLAFDPLTQDRVTVQAGRYSGDPSAELVAIRETNGRSVVSVFDGQNFSPVDSFFAGSR